jgi:hypothetical protein
VKRGLRAPYPLGILASEIKGRSCNSSRPHNFPKCSCNFREMGSLGGHEEVPTIGEAVLVPSAAATSESPGEAGILLQNPIRRFLDELEVTSSLERVGPIHPGDARLASE